jgi:hypothetical protein
MQSQNLGNGSPPKSSPPPTRFVCWQCPYKGTRDELDQHGIDSGHTIDAPNPMGGPRIPVEDLDLPELDGLISSIQREQQQPQTQAPAVDPARAEKRKRLASLLSDSALLARAFLQSLVIAMEDPALTEAHPRCADELATVRRHMELRVIDMDTLAASGGIVHV